MEGYGVFFTRPVSAIVLSVSILSFAIPLIQQSRKKRAMTKPK
jgi:TctA family transporter